MTCQRSKPVALFLLFTFVITSMNPNSFANVTTPELPASSLKALEIPAEFGEITDSVPGSPTAPTLIHIQSAHGNYDAEKNIDRLLGYIEKNSSIRLMLLEGAAHKLQPELFRMFPHHPEFSRKVTDKLMREGYLTGPETFLVESAKKIEGYGIEDINAYKKDRDAFMEVVRSDHKAKRYLLKLRAHLERRFAAKMNQNLQSLIRLEDSVDAGTLSLESWLKSLKTAAADHLSLDLSDAFYQTKWPFLIRYFRLQEIGSKIQSEKARKEANAFIEELQERRIAPDILRDFKAVVNIPEAELFQAISRTAKGYSPLRLAFDRAFAKLPQDFSMASWPAWTLYAQYVILMQELDGKGLQEETARLQDQVFDALAKTPDEKEFLRLSRDLHLWRRLFNLELTRSEYEELSLAQSAKGKAQSKNLELCALSLAPEFKALIGKAMEFYQVAVDREKIMFRNALHRMQEQKQPRAIMITGGFHTDGLKELAAAKGCSYLQITPNIREVTKRDHQIYLRSVFGSPNIDHPAFVAAGWGSPDNHQATKNKFQGGDFEASQMSGALGLDPRSMAQIFGAKLREWWGGIQTIVAGEMNSEPAQARPSLVQSWREFSAGITLLSGAQVALAPASVKRSETRSAPTDEELVRLAEFMRWHEWAQVYYAKSGHFGGSASDNEMMALLYSDPRVFRLDPSRPDWEYGDHLVISKAHASPSLYSPLYLRSWLEERDVADFRHNTRGRTPGHVTKGATPNVFLSGGVLGYGAPMATGMAMFGRAYDLDFHTFTIIGDMEAGKGAINEMREQFPKFGITRFTGIIDYNQYGQTGATTDFGLSFEQMAGQWKIAGWNVVTINGEKFQTLDDNLQYIQTLRQALLDSKDPSKTENKPTMILVKSIKGRGISFVEEAFRNGDTRFHGAPPTATEYDTGTREIAKRLGINVEPTRSLSDIEAELKKIGAEFREKFKQWRLSANEIAAINTQNDAAVENARQERLKPTAALPTGTPKPNVATRVSAAEALLRIAGVDPDIFFVSISEASNSINFDLLAKFFGVFSSRNPHGRVVKIGIREDYGAAVTVGFKAAAGNSPKFKKVKVIAGSFERFFNIVINLIMYAIMEGIPVGWFASHTGIEVGEDGIGNNDEAMPALIQALSHHGKRMNLLNPSDRTGADIAVQQMVAGLEAGQSAYLRASRMPRQDRDRGAVVYNGEAKGEGFNIWKDVSTGKTPDIVLVVSEATVTHGLVAAEKLEKEKHLEVRVIEVTSLSAISTKHEGQSDLSSWLNAGVPVYAVFDSSETVLYDAMNHIAQTKKAFIPVFSRGITDRGSDTTEGTMAANRFTANPIAEDAQAVILHNADPEHNVLPAGIFHRSEARSEVRTGPWTQEEIRGFVVEVLANTLKISPDSIQSETVLKNLISQIDSLTFIEILGELEDKLGFPESWAPGASEFSQLGQAAESWTQEMTVQALIDSVIEACRASSFLRTDSAATSQPRSEVRAASKKTYDLRLLSMAELGSLSDFGVHFIGQLKKHLGDAQNAKEALKHLQLMSQFASIIWSSSFGTLPLRIQAASYLIFGEVLSERKLAARLDKIRTKPQSQEVYMLNHAGDAVTALFMSAIENRMVQAKDLEASYKNMPGKKQITAQDRLILQRVLAIALQQFRSGARKVHKSKSTKFRKMPKLTPGQIDEILHGEPDFVDDEGDDPGDDDRTNPRSEMRSIFETRTSVIVPYDQFIQILKTWDGFSGSAYPEQAPSYFRPSNKVAHLELRRVTVGGIFYLVGLERLYEIPSGSSALVETKLRAVIRSLPLEEDVLFSEGTILFQEALPLHGLTKGPFQTELLHTEGASIVNHMAARLGGSKKITRQIASEVLKLALSQVRPASDLSAFSRKTRSEARGNSGDLLIKGGRVVTPAGVIENGAVLVRDGKILEVGDSAQVQAPEDAKVVDASGMIVGPGFVDLHIHGAGNIRLNSTESADFETMAKALYRYGVTYFLPTATAASFEELMGFLNAAREAQKSTLGIGPVHFEGPWINPVAKGAQPEQYILKPEAQAVRDFLQRADGFLRILTLAPEVFLHAGNLSLITEMAKYGVLPSFGHTYPTAEEMQQIDFAKLGITMATHAYNAIGKKEDYLIDTLLASKILLTVILDLVHVPLDGPKGIRRMLENLSPVAFISDALNAGGQNATIAGETYVAGTDPSRGDYRAFFHPTKKDRMGNRLLGGSVMGMSDIFRNAVIYLGLEVPDAFKTTSTTPAQAIGEKNRGEIAPGKQADMVILDPSHQVVSTIINGHVVYQRSEIRATTAVYGDDVAFLKKHLGDTGVIELTSQDGTAKVAVAPAFQGRVMTSTADGAEGQSFGFINRPVIEEHTRTGIFPKHIFVSGGEDRFWMGPEGGQFAIFFRKIRGQAARLYQFVLNNWQTPPVIDTEAFEVDGVPSADKVSFKRQAQVTNWFGTKFNILINRTIQLLSKKDVARHLNVTLSEGVKVVAFESQNKLTNVGKRAWIKATGLLSIWILGMYNPSPETTVVVPHTGGAEAVNDSYFGSIPADRLVKRQGVGFFKADAKARGKIGVAPQFAKPVMGSYDAANGVLTIVQYTKPEGVLDYVNSAWEFLQQPWRGDVVNSYNDDGSLGRFYELESSSPAARLRPGASINHVHRTIHLLGSEADLDPIARTVLGVSLDEIKSAFSSHSKGQNEAEFLLMVHQLREAQFFTLDDDNNPRSLAFVIRQLRGSAANIQLLPPLDRIISEAGFDLATSAGRTAAANFIEKISRRIALPQAGDGQVVDEIISKSARGEGSSIGTLPGRSEVRGAPVIKFGRREWYPGIGKVTYGGPNAQVHRDKDFQFEWYDEDAVIGGKTMKEWLNFSGAAWHLNNPGGDPFGPGTKDYPWLARLNDPNLTNAEKVAIYKQKIDAMFEILAKLGIPNYAWHDRDLAPEVYFTSGKRKGELDVEQTNANLWEIARHLKKRQEESGIKLLWGTANLFSAPKNKDGAATSPDFRVLLTAAGQVKTMLEITKFLGGANYVLWGGREGYYSLLNNRTPQEKRQLALFLKMVRDHAKAIGFKGKLLIEPKPYEPTGHQYDHDVEAVLGFLRADHYDDQGRKFNLYDDYYLNIEVNHATLAGHTAIHEFTMASAAGKFVSVDANTGGKRKIGVPDLGYDTDMFPGTDEGIETMLVAIAQGGFLGGGVHFDAKTHRTSTNLSDMFHAHVLGMDSFAKGLIIAFSYLGDKNAQRLLAKRYASYKSPAAKRFLNGDMTLAEAAALDATLPGPEPRIQSARLEAFERVLEKHKANALHQWLAAQIARGGRSARIAEKYFAGLGLKPTRALRAGSIAGLGAFAADMVQQRSEVRSAESVESEDKELKNAVLHALLTYLNLAEVDAGLLGTDIVAEVQGRLELNERTLDELYARFKDKPILTIDGAQSQAMAFEVYLRDARSAPLENSRVFVVPRANRVPKYAIEIRTERHQRKPVPADIFGTTTESVREQIKFINVINYLTQPQKQNDFNQYLGQVGMQYYRILGLVRHECLAERKSKGDDVENDLIDIRDFKGFRAKLRKALQGQTHISTDEKDFITFLKKEIDGYIDVNDLMVELLHQAMDRGTLSREEANLILYLQQVVVGIVSEEVARDIKKETDPISFGEYNYAIQKNPGRAKRVGLFPKGMVGRKEETILTHSYLDDFLPLQRYLRFQIPARGIEVRQLANPYPHELASLNTVFDPIKNQGVNLADLQTILAILRSSTPFGGTRYRSFFNGPFAGHTINHLHYQGFLGKTNLESAVEIKGSLEGLGTDENGVEHFRLNPEHFKGKARFPLRTMLVVKGGDSDQVAKAVIKILRQTNEDGSLPIVPRSKFTYNLFFVDDGESSYVYIMIKHLETDIFDPENLYFMEPEILVFTNEPEHQEAVQQLQREIQAVVDQVPPLVQSLQEASKVLVELEERPAEIGPFKFSVDDLTGNFDSNSLTGNGLPAGWDQGKLDTIRERLRKGESFTKEDWVKALNEILPVKMTAEVYQAIKANSSIQTLLDQETRALLDKVLSDRANMTPKMTEHLNRRILEAFYPQQIRKTQEIEAKKKEIQAIRNRLKDLKNQIYASSFKPKDAPKDSLPIPSITTRGLKQGLILYKGRPASVEMTDLLIYAEPAQVVAFEKVKANLALQRWVVDQVFERCEFQNENFETLVGIIKAYLKQTPTVLEGPQTSRSEMRGAFKTTSLGNFDALEFMKTLYQTDQERYSLARVLMETGIDFPVDQGGAANFGDLPFMEGQEDIWGQRAVHVGARAQTKEILIHITKQLGRMNQQGTWVSFHEMREMQKEDEKNAQTPSYTRKYDPENYQPEIVMHPLFQDLARDGKGRVFSLGIEATTNPTGLDDTPAKKGNPFFRDGKPRFNTTILDELAKLGVSLADIAKDRREIGIVKLGLYYDHQLKETPEGRQILENMMDVFERLAVTAKEAGMVLAPENLGPKMFIFQKKDDTFVRVTAGIKSTDTKKIDEELTPKGITWDEYQEQYVRWLSENSIAFVEHLKTRQIDADVIKASVPVSIETFTNGRQVMSDAERLERAERFANAAYRPVMWLSAGATNLAATAREIGRLNERLIEMGKKPIPHVGFFPGRVVFLPILKRLKKAMDESVLSGKDEFGLIKNGHATAEQGKVVYKKSPTLTQLTYDLAVQRIEQESGKAFDELKAARRDAMKEWWQYISFESLQAFETAAAARSEVRGKIGRRDFIGMTLGGIFAIPAALRSLAETAADMDIRQANLIRDWRRQGSLELLDVLESEPVLVTGAPGDELFQVRDVREVSLHSIPKPAVLSYKRLRNTGSISVKIRIPPNVKLMASDNIEVTLHATRGPRQVGILLRGGTRQEMTWVPLNNSNQVTTTMNLGKYADGMPKSISLIILGDQEGANGSLEIRSVKILTSRSEARNEHARLTSAQIGGWLQDTVKEDLGTKKIRQLTPLFFAAQNRLLKDMQGLKTRVYLDTRFEGGSSHMLESIELVIEVHQHIQIASSRDLMFRVRWTPREGFSIRVQDAWYRDYYLQESSRPVHIRRALMGKVRQALESQEVRKLLTQWRRAVRAARRPQSAVSPFASAPALPASRRSEVRSTPETQSARPGRAPNYFLGFNASTQSFTVTMIAVNSKGQEVVWEHQELYDSEKYSQFGTKEGHVTSVLAKDKTRYVTNPLMVAEAFQNSIEALKEFCAEQGIDMSRIRMASPGAQQHATVYLTKKAMKGFNPNSRKRLWQQIQDGGYLAWEHSPIWQDTSTGAEAAEFVANKRFGSEAELHRRTGSTSNDLRFPGLQIAKFRKDHPDKWEKTYRVMNMTAFIGYLWTGEIAFPWDPGDAVPSHLVDVKTQNWLPFVDKLVPGLSKKLGLILPTTEEISRISPYWVGYGFSDSMGVANGSGDNPAALVAMNLSKKGSVAVSLGTSFTIYQYISNMREMLAAIAKSRIGNIMGTPFGKWMKLVCFQNGGLALEGIRDRYISNKEAVALITGKGLKDGTKFSRSALSSMKKDERDKWITIAKWEIFEEILKATAPGNGGKMMITQSKNEAVITIKKPKGQIPYFVGFTNEDFSSKTAAKNRATILRAAVEGQIFFLKYVANAVGMEISEIHLTGGAAKNASIRQIIADMFNVPVYGLKKSEPVSRGMANNAYKTWYDAMHAKSISWKRASPDLLEEKPTMPNAAHAQTYEGLLPKFGELVQRAQEKSAKRSELRNEDLLEENQFLLPRLPTLAQLLGAGASVRSMLRTASDVSGNILPLVAVAWNSVTEIAQALFPAHPTDSALSGDLAEQRRVTARMTLGYRTVSSSDVHILGPGFFTQDIRVAPGMREDYPKATIVAIVETQAQRDFLMELNTRLGEEHAILMASATNPKELRSHLAKVRQTHGSVRPIAWLYGSETLPDALRDQIPNVEIVTPRMLRGFLNAMDMLVSSLVQGLQARFAMARSA